jgi:membrane protein implicated in regulation of membrane protease activity
MSYAWIVWLIIAAIFIGIEVFTPGFFLLWFGVGARWSYRQKARSRPR